MIPKTWTQMPGVTKDQLVNATEIAKVFGFTFYEHPKHGDEHPLLAVPKGSTAVFNTHDFDVPDYI
jgi:hypothetical protein